MRVRLFFFCVLWSVLVCAQDENAVRQRYMQAEEEYKIGRFEEAARLLDSNMNHFTGTLKTSAYRLMSLCYLGKDDMQRAEEYVSLLLKEDPYYNVTLQDPLRFADMVERFKKGQVTITTASQQEETVDEAPVPVTLITEEMIKASGARNLADLLLLYVPGMSNIEGTEKNVAMHGVYSVSQEKILIMLDGHRLNSRATNSEAPDFRTSLDKIKQIEVLRGPSSSLYGNVALTAVVNIITKKGREVDGIQLSAGVGSNETYRTNFLMGKSGIGIDFMAWASFYSSRGEKRNVDVSDKEFYGKIPVMGSLYIDGYNHKPSYDLGFTCQWNDVKLMFNTQYSKKVTQYNSVFYPGLYSYDCYRKVNGVMPGSSRQSTHLDLCYEKSWSQWSAKLNAFVDLENCTRYDVAGDSILDGEMPFGSEIVGEVIPDISKALAHRGIYQVQSWNDYVYGGIAQCAYSYHYKKVFGTLLAGLQFENYTMKDNTMLIGDLFNRVVLTSSDENRSVNLGNEMNLSGFFQMKVNYGKKFIFNGGLRFDFKHRFNGRNLQSYSPRLSFIYKMNQNMNLKFSYSHSFVDAPFFYRANNIATYSGGSTLDSEKMDAFQLNFNWNINALNLKYESNIYYNKLSDLIFYDRKKMEDMYSNAGALKLLGIENVFAYQHSRSMAHLNFSYQYVVDSYNYVTNGSSIFGVPKFRLNLFYGYKLLQSKLNGNLMLQANMNYLSKQKTPLIDPFIYKGQTQIYNPDNTVDARAIFNVGFNYTYKKIGLLLDIYNVLDADYYQGGNSMIPLPQQGRSLIASVSYKF